MENIKYIAFYTLLLVLLVLGFLNYSWLIIAPAALILSFAYIAVKGEGWRQIMGKNDMNAGAVFIAVLFSQVITATLFFGIGKLGAMLFG